MVLKAFSIRDQKVGVYNMPWFKTSHGEAERDFRTICNDEKSKINMYPEDFDLYHIGEYDDNTGVFKPLDTPHHVIKAVECINPQ